MLLSLDWDYFVGSADLIFDSPLWGTADTVLERDAAWSARAVKRGGSSFETLREDFPLLVSPKPLEGLVGVPCFACVTHSDAYDLLRRLEIRQVLNFDSHHDLYSSSGDPQRVRPGNWAGLALERGVIDAYTCRYPVWHSDLRVTEGFDLERTRSELPAKFSSFNLTFERGGLELPRSEIEAVLLVQSPSWTNPLFDPDFLELCAVLNAEFLEPPLERRFIHKP
jgi:hypothetical protein